MDTWASILLRSNIFDVIDTVCLHPPRTSVIGILTIPTLQMRSLNSREMKSLDQGHTARKWQRRNLKRSVGAQVWSGNPLLTGSSKVEKDICSPLAGVRMHKLKFCFVSLNSVKGKEWHFREKNPSFSFLSFSTKLYFTRILDETRGGRKACLSSLLQTST